VPRPRCAGVSVTLDEQGPDGARQVALACDEHGARLVVATSPNDVEGSYDERTLDLAEANQVWAAIAAVRWQALACAGEGAAHVRRSLRVAGPGGEQTARCDADRPSAAWTAIEAALAPPPTTATDMELWQFQAEYWRDELGYARATAALGARLPGVSR